MEATVRAVISHFYNEEYLLPWWLAHHVDLFDVGILINHGSTDRSVEIARELAPHWRIVNSRLTQFDAALTDLEVSNYEWELPTCWKIALNITEFVLPARPLSEIESELTEQGRMGCACSGFIVVDDAPERAPTYEQPLVLQKHWGLDDNAVQDPDLRASLGLPRIIGRNRFYHSNSTGLYTVGRHASAHPDYAYRSRDLLIFHYRFAPWTEAGVRRKTHHRDKMAPADIARGWGAHHVNSDDEWTAQFRKVRPNAIDLSSEPAVRGALRRLTEQAKGPGQVPAVGPRAERSLDYARVVYSLQVTGADLQAQIAQLQTKAADAQAQVAASQAQIAQLEARLNAQTPLLTSNTRTVDLVALVVRRLPRIVRRLFRRR
ncbi:MAG: glycosyltransferase family 2 protein [Devosia sp.]|uniref:glycosyltransferase family 2 protein n=1 Tax=Devosia sp. TaxID=1871048 RepID=UPI001A536775|nr:glycosyltransferase family 2 protein [Devosia sp.]MBL8600256.1 glycosyltransferase family 2 protein [Devosia sp.]